MELPPFPLGSRHPVTEPRATIAVLPGLYMFVCAVLALELNWMLPLEGNWVKSV